MRRSPSSARWCPATGRRATSPRHRSLPDAPESPEALYGAVDVGGTNQTVAIGDSAGRLRAVRRLRTAVGAGAPEIVAGVTAALRACCDELGLEATARIGVGFGGPVSFERGEIMRSNHVSAWDAYPLRAELADAFGCAVVLDNDANAGALGEARFGAGRGHADLIYVNVGTGIGAGLVLGGQLYRGAGGLAGEIGHVTVAHGADASPCACGKRGCLEAYASGRAIGGREVTDAARRGDAAAQARLGDAGQALAVALGAAVNLLNASAVVIGGGVSDADELLLAPLRAALAAELMPGMPVPLVVRAALGYDAGVVGALALAIDG